MADKFILGVAFVLVQSVFFAIYMDAEMSVKVSESSIKNAVKECGNGFVNIRPYRAVSDGLYIETLCKDGRNLRVRIQ